MSEGIRALAQRLRESRATVALTGAGVSTDSGIPDFRSASSGLWRDHDPSEVASIAGFRADPRRFYRFWGERFAALASATPNITHRLLAELEARGRFEAQGRLEAIVTQNIDGLHQRAGSQRVIEVHGSYRKARCIHCGRAEPLDDVLARVAQGRLPICEACGDLVKPDVVLFGELLPASVFREAERVVSEASLLLVLGSSLEVHPVAGLVPLAEERGVAIAIVNREAGPYDDAADLVIHGELARVSEALLTELA